MTNSNATKNNISTIKKKKKGWLPLSISFIRRTQMFLTYIGKAG